MLKNIMNLTKVTMKLLLRNKGFLFFSVLIPIAATLLLNVNHTSKKSETDNKISNIKEMDGQLAYLTDYTMYPVKVYDSSDSELTISVLEELASAGIFEVYRVDSSEYTADEIMKSATKMAETDKIGCIMIVGPEFEKQIIDGKENDCISVYKTSDDERFEVFEDVLKQIVSTYAGFGSMTGTKEGILQAVKESRELLPEEELTDVNVNKSIGIDHIDYSKTYNFGNTLAVITLAAVFSGIMILGTILKEKQNLVFTRIMLSEATVGQYVASKFIIIVLTDILQTFIMAMTFVLFVKNEVCLTLPQFILLGFLVGLIFTSASVCIGLVCNSVLSASYAAFLIWMISSLLSGLYFDISYSSQWFKQIALFMPQRWALKSAQMFLDGSSHTLPIIFSVTAAYLIVILVIGTIGIKLSNKE